MPPETASDTASDTDTDTDTAQCGALPVRRQREGGA